MGDNAFSLLPQELRHLIASLCQLYCTPTWKVSGGLGRVSLLINWTSNKDYDDCEGRQEKADGTSLQDFLPKDRDRMWDREWCEVKGAGGDSSTLTSSGYEQLKDTTHLSSMGGPFSSYTALKSLPDSSSADELNTDSDYPLDSSLSSSCFSTSQSHVLLLDRSYDKLQEKTAPNTSVLKRQSGTSKAKAKMERSSFSSMPNLLSQGNGSASHSAAPNGKAEGSKQKAGVKWKKALLGVLRPRKAKAGSASEKKGNHQNESVDRAKSSNHPQVKPKHSASTTASVMPRKKSTDYVRWEDYGKMSKNHPSQEFTNACKTRKPFLDNRTKLDVNRRFSKVTSEDQTDLSDCPSEVTVTAEIHSEYSTEACDTPRSSVSQSISSEKNLENKGYKVKVDPPEDSNYNSGYTSMSSVNVDSDDVSPIDSVSMRVTQTLKVPTTVTDGKGKQTSITTNFTEMRQILLGAVKEYDTQAWVREHSLNSKGQLDMGASKSYRRHSHAGVIPNTLDTSEVLLQRHTKRTKSVNYSKMTQIKQSQTAALRGIQPHFLKDQNVVEDHDSSSYVVSEDDVEICMDGTVRKLEITGSNMVHSSEKEEPSTPESGATKLVDSGSIHIPSNFKMKVTEIEPADNLDENMPNLELLDKFACSSEPAKSLKTRFESFWKEKLGEKFRILIVLDSKKSSKPRLQIAEVKDYKVIEQANPAEETSSIFCMVKVTFAGQDKKYDRWLRPSELARSAYTQKTF